MLHYVRARVLWAVVIILGIVVLNFVLTRIIPGDPVTALVGEFPAPQAYVDQVRRELGLDEPIHVQLGLYLVQLLQGNLGFSFANRQAVLPLILQRAGATLMLMIPALVMASILGILMAVWAARSGKRSVNSGITALSLIGTSIPVFWLAQLLIMLFAVRLGWLPAQGMTSVRTSYTGLAWVFDYMRHLALPALCITTSYLAVVARVARSSMFEMLNQDFVLTARAKGISDGAVMWRHVLRNGLIPVITVIGYSFGYSLTGAILTETVFGWPGLGSLFVTSIDNRDYAVLSGIFLLAATAVALANLATDILYAVVDPRVRSATFRRA